MPKIDDKNSGKLKDAKTYCSTSINAIDKTC